MRAINHALTGAVIGLTVTGPVVALPLAILSHYVCDAVPHWGGGEKGKQKEAGLRSKSFELSLYIDAMLCGLLVLVLIISGTQLWLLGATCAFLAAAPDFLSINRYLKVRQHKKWHPGWYTKFAGGIQWFERPIGLVVEVAWAAGFMALLAPFLR